MSVTIDSVTYSLSGTTATATGFLSPPNPWNLVIPSTITYLGTTYTVIMINSNAFISCTVLLSLTIPNTVTSIGSAAFRFCNNLTSVTFAPNSTLTNIGPIAFRDCTKLITATIPDSVTSIGDSIFRSCTALTSITIPNTIKNIGYDIIANAFNNIIVNYNPNRTHLPSDVTWYDFNVKLNSTNTIILDGYFVLINSTNFVKLMYLKTDLTTNIKAQYSRNDYGNYHYWNATNGFSGVNINSIPALDNTYNASKWQLFGNALNYQNATNGTWTDLPNGTVTYSFTEISTPSFPICFPAGTPVVTDQGIIAIDKINPEKNTIRGKKIVAITKTTTLEDKIVCIEKDALAPSVPSQKTFISRQHKLLYNKKMIKAKHLVGQVDGVYNKKYNGEVLYNVLLETHEKMLVNNLIVETLDPKNVIAQLYNGSLSVEERNNAIININHCANEYKKQYGKLK